MDEPVNIKEESFLTISLLSVLLILLSSICIFSSGNFDFRKRAVGIAPQLSDGDLDYSVPLSAKKPIYKFTASGVANLTKENSYLRLILVDSKGAEYLVYEVSSILTNRKIVSLDNVCDETCLLKAVTPVWLRIEGYGVVVKLAKTATEESLAKASPGVVLAGVELEREKIRHAGELARILAIDSVIKQKGLTWIAGETSVSKLTYSQKKKLFTTVDGKAVKKLPNLQGFEYYKGGIFKIFEDSNSLAQLPETPPANPTPTNVPTNHPRPTGTITPIPNIPSSWDWRNVHGENWNTGIRDQGQGGTCWAHAQIGAFEAQLNLFFNQHLDVNLSEQMLVDCQLTDERPIGMGIGGYPECLDSINNYQNNCYPGNRFCLLGIHGVPDEECDLYVGREPTRTHFKTSFKTNNIQAMLKKPW